MQHEPKLGGTGRPDAEFADDGWGAGWGGEAEDKIEGAVCGRGEHGGEVGVGLEEGRVWVGGPGVGGEG